METPEDSIPDSGDKHQSHDWKIASISKLYRHDPNNQKQFRVGERVVISDFHSNPFKQRDHQKPTEYHNTQGYVVGTTKCYVDVLLMVDLATVLRKHNNNINRMKTRGSSAERLS